MMLYDTFTPGGAVNPPSKYDITNPDSDIRKTIEDSPLDLDLDIRIPSFTSGLGTWWDNLTGGIGDWFNKSKWWVLLVLLLVVGVGAGAFGLSKKRGG